MRMTIRQAESFPFGDLNDFTALGDDHWFKLITCSDECPGAGYHGLFQPHFKDGKWCGGSCAFRGHGTYAHWHVVKMRPLEIDPSFLCKGCGDHGWIQDGRWVKAA